MSRIIIGMGSNIEPRRLYLERAIEEIGLRVGKNVRSSGFFRTTPMKLYEENDSGSEYINCAVQCDTTLKPDEALKVLLTIEAELGRTRTEGRRWESRTIDLDLLFYDDVIMNCPTLTIPHPGVVVRDFVLMPLAEIAPDFIHPVIKRTISELARDVQFAPTTFVLEKLP